MIRPLTVIAVIGLAVTIAIAHENPLAPADDQQAHGLEVFQGLAQNGPTDLKLSRHDQFARQAMPRTQAALLDEVTRMPAIVRFPHLALESSRQYKPRSKEG